MSDLPKCEFCQCDCIEITEDRLHKVGCCAGVGCCPVHPETGWFVAKSEARMAWRLLQGVVILANLDHVSQNSREVSRQRIDMDRPDPEHDGKHSWYQYAVRLEGELKNLHALFLQAMGQLEDIKDVFEHSSPKEFAYSKELIVRDLGKLIMEINRRAHGD